MTKSVMHHLAQILRGKSKKSIAVLKKISSAHITMGLVAAVLFASAYALETKAVPVPEASQNPFGILRQSRSE
jgi:hypothetical protein